MYESPEEYTRKETNPYCVFSSNDSMEENCYKSFSSQEYAFVAFSEENLLSIKEPSFEDLMRTYVHYNLPLLQAADFSKFSAQFFRELLSFVVACGNFEAVDILIEKNKGKYPIFLEDLKFCVEMRILEKIIKYSTNEELIEFLKNLSNFTMSHMIETVLEKVSIEKEPLNDFFLRYIKCNTIIRWDRITPFIKKGVDVNLENSLLIKLVKKNTEFYFSKYGVTPDGLFEKYLLDHGSKNAEFTEEEWEKYKMENPHVRYS